MNASKKVPMNLPAGLQRGRQLQLP